MHDGCICKKGGGGAGVPSCLPVSRCVPQRAKPRHHTCQDWRRHPCCRRIITPAARGGPYKRRKPCTGGICTRHLSARLNRALKRLAKHSRLPWVDLRPIAFGNTKPSASRWALAGVVFYDQSTTNGQETGMKARTQRESRNGLKRR
jgi:hypothetical protein